MRKLTLVLALGIGLGITGAEALQAGVVADPAGRTVTLADGPGNLVLRLRHDGRCVLDEVRVRGRNVVGPETGVACGIRIGGRQGTTRSLPSDPRVEVTGDTVTVTGIACDTGGLAFRESWHFVTAADRIRWRIEREYLGDGGVVDGSSQPEWGFLDLTTWTGGLLEHGGVAWCKLFDRPGATYGVHGGSVTLWNRSEGSCLRITGSAPAELHLATRFTREPAGGFTLAQTADASRLATRYGQSRFLRERPDVWAPWRIRPGTVTVEWTLEALPYDRVFDRGEFAGFNGGAIREILNTIARIGAIDDEVMGSNGYYSGFAVLHEPWIAQLGLAIDDPGYFRAYARTLDHQRDHAIGPDGRVKSRWAYTPGDEEPGTYDARGYYECQWGRLMDSQPGYVINVAELFDFTGDRAWLGRHQASCEKALGFLLDRDSDGDGLVEMAVDSHRAGKGSDWIDVIWAAHENGFVNAQLHQALVLWADAEELLGNPTRAAEYRRRAATLRARFNAPTTAGGFWDEAGRRYAYWRDRDDSVHGMNLVVPVNFMAVAYGLCDSPEKERAILDQIEARTAREGLFFWPLCLDSYAPGEGAAWQFPFPKYENGDLFLAWGELGTRAYARHEPALAVKYVRNVLARYERDGLAFQRYLRTNQQGEGLDILANNASPVVGLYRNIYGLQPKWNRLLLDPHLVPDLDGTRVRYDLRGRLHEVTLTTRECRVAADGFALRGAAPFGIGVEAGAARYFHGTGSEASLVVNRPAAGLVDVAVLEWSADPSKGRRWTVGIAGGGGGVLPEQRVRQLAPEAVYRLRRDAAAPADVRADAGGTLVIRVGPPSAGPVRFELDPVVGSR